MHVQEPPVCSAPSSAQKRARELAFSKVELVDPGFALYVCSVFWGCACACICRLYVRVRACVRACGYACWVSVASLVHHDKPSCWQMYSCVFESSSRFGPANVNEKSPTLLLFLFGFSSVAMGTTRRFKFPRQRKVKLTKF